MATTAKPYHQPNIQALCIFCYKSCNQNYHNGKSRTEKHQFVVQVRFFQMVQRYFEYKRTSTVGYNNSSSSPSCGKLTLPQEGEGEGDCKIGCCADCFNIIDSYCDIYHEMKVLEMELDRKLDTLSNIMTYAERVPSRISGYRDWCLRERLDMEKSMNFRRKFQKQCEISNRRSFPRVRLNRKQAEEAVSNDTDIVISVEDNILSLLTPPHCQESEFVSVSASSPESPISAVELDCEANQSQSNQENVLSPSPSPSDTDNRRLELDLSNIKILQSPLKQSVTDTSNACYPVPLASMKVSHSPDEETSDFPSPPASPEPEVTEPFLKRIKFSSPDATMTTRISRVAEEREDMEEQSNLEKSTEESSSPRRRKIRQLSKCTICKATFSAPAKLLLHISIAHQSSSCNDDNGDDDYEDNIDKDTADDDWVDDEEYILQTDNELERENRNKPENRRKSSHGLDLSSESNENQGTDKEAATTIKKEIITVENMTLAIDAALASQVPILPSTSKPNGSFTCTKCPEISFETLQKFQVHHNYLHTNGHFKMRKLDFKKRLRQTQKLLKLKSINSHQIFECHNHPQTSVKCSKEFMLEEELKNHMEYHEQIKCETCGEEMDNIVDMVLHEIEHFADVEAGPRSLTCGKCSFTATCQGELVNHYLEIHRNRPGLQATCPICQHEFKYVEKVPMLHYVNYHDLTRLEDPSSSGITCTAEACSAYFLTEDQLQQYWSSVHDKKSVETLFREKRIALRNKNKTLVANKRKLAMKRRGYKCDECKIKFCDEIKLKTHQLFSCSNITKDKLEEYGRIQLTEDGMTIDDFINAGGNFSCKTCEKVFELEEQLEKHSKLHGDFKCNFCDVIKTHATELAIHETVHNVGKTNNGNKASFQCPRCKFKTQRRAIYIKHHVETHLNMEMESERKQCPICKTPESTWKGSWTSPRSWMIFHYFEYHDKNNLDYETMPKCNQCPAYFRTDFQLEKHSREIHKVDKYQCGTCEKIFPDWAKLRHHRKKTHKVNESEFEFLCDFPDCGRKFEFEMERDSHKRTSHALGAMQRCSKCERTFVGSFQLKYHMTTHEEKKDEMHVCEVCGKVFTTKNKLYNHNKIHEYINEKKYVCKICSKVCRSGTKLREHSRVHAQEKPFVCQMCGASYAHAHNLRIHMKNKHQH